jgi:CRISPR-associated endonuclease/helicase Cas3
VILLHSRFLPEDRAELENQIISRCGKYSGQKDRDHLVVVGTQVLEQSLDLDFDLLFTEACPMDLLLQRMGRLHRHRNHDAVRPAKMKNPCCVICSDEYYNVYSPWLLKKTDELLQSREAICLPDEIRMLVDAAYETGEDMEDPVKRQYLLREGISQAKADNWRISAPADTLLRGLTKTSQDTEADGNLAASVRDGIDGIRVLLLKIDGEYVSSFRGAARVRCSETPDFESGREILRQTLALPAKLSHADTVKEIQMMDTVLTEWATDPRFEEQLIVLADGKGRFCLNGYSCIYTHDKGLIITDRNGG